MLTQPLLDTDRYSLNGSVTALADTFDRDHYVRLPGLLTSEGLEALRAEAVHLEQFARRRDFLMESMENSPRHMTTIGGHTIVEHSSLIPNLYANAQLIELIRHIVSIDIQPVPDRVERFVINYLHKPGDVHGAHFDDHPIAFVAFLEVPPHGTGGELEMVPRAQSLLDIESDEVRRLSHDAGDCYLLKTDTSAHRVAPLRAPARRVVLNMAFASPESAKIKSESASLLYN
jgi:hypothetical protein